MQVIFGAESTGHYFLNLAFWLHQRNEQVVLVNPKTTKRNKENRDNKPSKNDAKDAIIIADTVSHGYYSEWVIHETLYRKLRCLVNERDALVTDLTAIGNQLQPALDQSFPIHLNGTIHVASDFSVALRLEGSYARESD